MRPAILFIAVLFLISSTFAQDGKHDAQSTSGPRRPDALFEGFTIKDGGVEVTIPGVPAYIWYNGCGPTAAGMVIGYWDGQGFETLVEGDASTQTPEVNAMISTSGNYDDYCIPLDAPPNPIKPDKSEPPVGDEHPDDCMADFMKTSQSYYNNYYGCTWFSQVKGAMADYVDFVDSHHYQTVVTNLKWKNFPWSLFKSEIDAQRPVVFLVDTDGDGTTDHFVTAIGYAEESGKLYYGCRDTWDTGIHWYEFKKIASGQTWGIYSATTFQISASSMVFYVPGDFATIQGAIDASLDGDLILVKPGTFQENIDFSGKAVEVRSTDGPAITFIDGGQKSTVVTFGSGEGLDSVLDGFTLMNGYASQGGGIHCLGASPLIRNNLVMGCAAQNGGAIGIQFEWPGGAPHPIIENCSFFNNMAINGSGVFICGAENCTFTGNFILKNTGGTSGGIYCAYSVGMKISDNVISENGGCGIRIRCDKGTLVSNNEIRMNLQDGILLDQVVSDTFIEKNTITSNGGSGICHWTGSFGHFRDNVIQGNLHGGILCGDTKGSAPPIVNNLILGNSKIGGICCVQNCNAAILNNTIVGNIAKSKGGGISCYTYSSPSVSNTILWDNTAPLGPEIYLGVAGQPSILSIHHSDVKGGKASVYIEPGCALSWGAGMLDADPLFIAPNEDDYHLQYPSPCRDSGSGSISGLPGEDFEGDPRIAAGFPDMGADEFHPHLYYLGKTSPGVTLEARLIGVPGTGPVRLWAGSGVLDPPMWTKYGMWYLESPLLFELDLGVIPPPAGVLTFTCGIPPGTPSPWEVPLQAGIGPDLSNLCLIKIE